MIARIVGLESGVGYVDKQRRVVLELDDADTIFNRLRMPEAALGIDAIVLDDILEVSFSVKRVATIGGDRRPS